MTQSPARAGAFTPSWNYIVTVALSWLVPGAGHWLLGYRVRGALIGATLLGIFWTGESLLADNLAVTRTVHPIFFSLQVGNGASALAADALWGEPRVPNQTAAIQRDLPRHLNLGILFCTVSGLLNVLAVLHVLDPRTWIEASEDRAGEPASAQDVGGGVVS